MKDLIVLTACKDGEYTMRGLLTRPKALGIRSIEADFRVHPQKDPGCLSNPQAIIGTEASRYRYALVLFDRDGSGVDDPDASGELERQAEGKLAAAGWQDRVRAIVIEPELEQWVWSGSPHVERALGWKDRTPGLRDWLAERGFLRGNSPKASPPKEAMQAALREARMPWSADIFLELASTVSAKSCTDPSFMRLRETLRSWFPA
jgi:hypothetical protein